MCSHTHVIVKFACLEDEGRLRTGRSSDGGCTV